MTKNFKIKFWGVRAGVPISTKDTIKFGGNTTCIEIQCDNQLIILEAGTGIHPLGNKIQNNGDLTGHIFFTKIDFERMSGLPFFVPGYSPRNKFTIVDSSPTNEHTYKEVSSLMSFPYFPIPIETMQGINNIKTILNHPIEKIIKGIKVSYLNPKFNFSSTGLKICFKNKCFTYISLSKKLDIITTEEINSFAENSDLLIVSNYADFPNLSTPEFNCLKKLLEFDDEFKAKLIVYCGHHQMLYDNSLQYMQNLLKKKNSLISYEGLEINL